MFSKLNKIFPIIAVGMLIMANLYFVIFAKDSPSDYEKQKPFYEKYEGTELKCEDSIFGKITMISIIKSDAFCIIDDSIRVTLRGENHLNNPERLLEIIEFGDTLLKNEYV